MRAWRNVKRLMGLALVLGTIWAAGLVWFAQRLPRQVADRDTRTDAIVVLTGGTLRVQEGVALLRARLAPKLFISGVARGVELSPLLLQDNVEVTDLPCCIELGYAALDTPGNAREIASWAAAQRITSFRLVTAAYHMPRSLLELRAALPAAIRIVPHPVFPPAFKQRDWYLWPGTSSLLIGEYHKYIRAWLRLTIERELRG